MTYSEPVRNQIILRLGAKMNYTQIARELRISRTGVEHFAKKLQETGSTNRRSGSGRNREHNIDIRKSILDYFKANSKRTYHDCIRDLKINCHKTFISRFKENKIRAYVAIKKSSLTEEHLDQRKTFATLTKDWTQNGWTKVIFTDEKIFMSHPNGQIKVKRTLGTAFEQRHLEIVPRRKFSINDWGCMIGSNLTLCVYRVDKKGFNSSLYRYLLRRVAFPKFCRKYKNNSFVFQQDNAPIHTSKKMQAFFDETQIYPMFWPAASPDLSPIENLWAILQKRVNKRLRNQNVNNGDELFQVVKEEAKSIEPKIIKNLYQSMPKRIKLLTENNYKRIKY